MARFEDDLSERRHAPRVREDRFGGERSGVEGTPTFFVNGMRYEDLSSCRRARGRRGCGK